MLLSVACNGGLSDVEVLVGQGDDDGLCRACCLHGIGDGDGDSLLGVAGDGCCSQEEGGE